MKEKEYYLILSAGHGGDFGSCTLISSEIWKILNGDLEKSEMSDALFEDLNSVMNLSGKEELLHEIESQLESFQYFHSLISNFKYEEKEILNAKNFDTLTEMIKFVKEKDIDVLDTSYDD